MDLYTQAPERGPDLLRVGVRWNIEDFVQGVARHDRQSVTAESYVRYLVTKRSCVTVRPNLDRSSDQMGKASKKTTRDEIGAPGATVEGQLCCSHTATR